jgi:hypothetical protein
MPDHQRLNRGYVVEYAAYIQSHQSLSLNDTGTDTPGPVLDVSEMAGSWRPRRQS